MYNINFLENEIIELDDNSAKIIVNDKILDIAIIKTNKRLLILKDTNRDIDNYEVLRITRAVSYLPNFELIFEIDLNNIEIIDNNEIKLKNGKEFTIISDVVFK